MTIDTNDNGTPVSVIRVDALTGLPTVTVEGWGTGTIAELEHHLKHLTDEREAGWDRVRALENKLDPLAMLADAIAALPVFKEMAYDLDDLRDRVEALEQSAEEIPTVEDVAQEIEHRGTIESAVETILADRADDPADNIEELAKAVADRLSVEVEIDDITVEASASVSVSQ